MRLVALSAAVALLAPACTWVHMAPGATDVRVVEAAPAGELVTLPM